MRVYSVGHNLSGYMPESDIYLTTDVEQALDALKDDLESAVDHYLDGAIIALDSGEYDCGDDTESRLREAADSGDTSTIRELVADSIMRNALLEYADLLDAIDVVASARADGDARYWIQYGSGFSVDVGHMTYWIQRVDDLSDMDDDTRAQLEDEGSAVIQGA